MSSSDRKSIVREYRFVNSPAQSGAVVEQEGAPEVEPDAATAEMAGALLTQVRAEASQILSQAYAQAETVRQQAREEGHQAGWEMGYAEGQAQAENEARAEVAALRQVLDSIGEQRAQLIRDAETDLAGLALAIARKVIGDIAAGQVDAIEHMAELAVTRLGQASVFSIHLHPEDARRLAAYWEEKGGKSDWELVPDERVAVGGCVVTSGASSVDARPETQLAVIQQAFCGLRGD